MIYLIEGTQEDDTFHAPFTQILTDLQLVDNFFLIQTKSEDETVNYLVALTHRLQSLLTTSSPPPPPPNIINIKFNNNQKSHIPNVKLLTELSYEQFCERVSKTRNLTLTDLFAKQLMQIRGVSAEKAAAIVRIYKTPRALVQAYQEQSDEVERSQLLCNIKVGKSQRRLGLSLSRRIALFYNDIGEGTTPLIQTDDMDTPE